MTDHSPPVSHPIPSPDRTEADDLALVLQHFPAPFSVGKPWPASWVMSAKAAKGDQVRVADMGGSGYLTGGGHGALGLSQSDGAAVQDAFARVLTTALNEYVARAGTGANDGQG